MTTTVLNELDWQVRLHVLRHFVEQGSAPTYGQIAERLAIPEADARAAFHRLDDAHTFFVLNPGTNDIRMANPLSAVPTPYRVRTQGVDLYATCALDSLGVPAMLHADAQIEAMIPGVTEPVRYSVESGKLIAPEGLVVHFPRPFRDWYDDLVHT